MSSLGWGAPLGLGEWQGGEAPSDLGAHLVMEAPPGSPLGVGAPLALECRIPVCPVGMEVCWGPRVPLDLGVPLATEVPREWGAPFTAGGPADPAWGAGAHPKDKQPRRRKPKIQIHGQAWNSEADP